MKETVYTMEVMEVYSHFYKCITQRAWNQRTQHNWTAFAWWMCEQGVQSVDRSSLPSRHTLCRKCIMYKCIKCTEIKWKTTEIVANCLPVAHGVYSTTCMKRKWQTTRTAAYTEIVANTSRIGLSHAMQTSFKVSITMVDSQSWAVNHPSAWTDATDYLTPCAKARGN